MNHLFISVGLMLAIIWIAFWVSVFDIGGFFFALATIYGAYGLLRALMGKAW